MRFLVLAVLLVLGGTPAVKAQTISRDSLDAFVAYLPVDRPARSPADLLTRSFRSYAFAPDLQAFLHAQGEGPGILVGFPAPPETRLLVNHEVIKVPEWNSRLVLLNDMLGVLRQDAVLTVWEQQGDSLRFDFLIDRTFPTSMGAVRLDGYVLLDGTARIDSSAFIERRVAGAYAPPDSTSLIDYTALVDSMVSVDSTMRVDTTVGRDSVWADSTIAEPTAATDSSSLLVIVREISEGAFHTVRFLHVQRDGTHHELAAHSFYYPPELIGVSRGTGYDIQRGADGTIAITLQGVKKQYVGDYFGYAYVINPTEELAVLQVQDLLETISAR